MQYAWFKIFHVFFVISWFAGLFYLPRIFVNLAAITDTRSSEYTRLLGMGQRLKRFMLILMAGTWLFGILLIINFPAWMQTGWMHAKLALVLLLSGYDGYCGRLLRDFKNNRNTKSHLWYRWFNEVPTLILFIVTILVILKPF